MHIGQKGLDLIKEFEGKELRSYLCPAGVWTIGYGSTGPHVKPNMVISEKDAEELLRKDVKTYEKAVLKAIAPLEPLQEEFDAMVSLCYNVGPANFSKSSIVRRYKKGDKEGAANAFHMWNKARVNGKLTVLKGLVRRRAAESQLFLSAEQSKTKVERNVSTTKTIVVPEESVVPEAPKSLAKSREIIIGSGLTIGGALEALNAIPTDHIAATKTAIEDTSKEIDGPIADDLYIPEIASVLLVIIGVFLIWKRYQDRINGVR